MGLSIPLFLVEIFVSFEETLGPFVDTALFVINYPFIWGVCYSQAYFFYNDFGGDQIFLICKEKSYGVYNTIFSSAGGANTGSGIYGSDYLEDNESEQDADYDYGG